MQNTVRYFDPRPGDLLKLLLITVLGIAGLNVGNLSGVGPNRRMVGGADAGRNSRHSIGIIS